MKHSINLIAFLIGTLTTVQGFAYVDAECRKTFYQGGQALEARSLWSTTAANKYQHGALTAFVDGTGVGGAHQGWDLIDHPDRDYEIIFYWFGGLEAGPWTLTETTSVFNIDGLEYDYSYDSPATCAGSFLIQ